MKPCRTCGADAMDAAGRCAACGTLDPAARDPSIPAYQLRIARKAWECHGAGNGTHSAYCTGTINPGDRCIEILDETPAYHSGPRVCAPCATWLYGINLADERNR